MEVLIVVVGWLLILVTRKLLSLIEVRPSPPKEEKPICGCAHHLSFHGDGGQCHYKPSTYYTCGCQKYIQKDTPNNVALYEKDVHGI